MFPDQPFYTSVREFQLNCVTSAPSSELVSYCGFYPTTMASCSHLTLVLAHFKPASQRPAADRRTATVVVNNRAYHGLPFTMVNVTQLLPRRYPTCFALSFQDIPVQVTVQVDEVSKVSEEKMLECIDESAPYVYKRDDTQALLKAFFTHGEYVTAGKLEVSLLCPRADRKMRVPCRGVHCSHVQCFDAYPYLACNEGTLEPTWCCPVCKDQVLVQDIRVDVFTLDVLRKVDKQCVTVVLRTDGSWEPVTSGDGRSGGGAADRSAVVTAGP